MLTMKIWCIEILIIFYDEIFMIYDILYLVLANYAGYGHVDEPK